MSNVERLSHLALKVADLERSAAFYVEVVGLSVHSKNSLGPHGLIVLNEGLGLTSAPREGGPGSPVEHLALKARSLEPVLKALALHGVPIVDGPRPSPYGNSVYFLDPDGNKVECHDGERQDT